MLGSHEPKEITPLCDKNNVIRALAAPERPAAKAKTVPCSLVRHFWREINFSQVKTLKLQITVSAFAFNHSLKPTGSYNKKNWNTIRRRHRQKTECIHKVTPLGGITDIKLRCFCCASNTCNRKVPGRLHHPSPRSMGSWWTSSRCFYLLVLRFWPPAESIIIIFFSGHLSIRMQQVVVAFWYCWNLCWQACWKTQLNKCSFLTLNLCWTNNILPAAYSHL